MISDVVCGASGREMALQISASCALRPMMIRANVAEAAALEPEHHRQQFIQAVPTEAAGQSADRLEAGARVHLDRAAGMKARSSYFAPCRTLGLEQGRADDAECGVAMKFGRQQLGQIGLETDIRIDPQNGVVVLPNRFGQELHKNGFPARQTLASHRKMLRLDPRMRARGLREDRGGLIGGSIVDDNPARRPQGLRRHRGNQARKELLLVARRSYRQVPHLAHATYRYIAAPSKRVAHSGRRFQAEERTFAGPLRTSELIWRGAVGMNAYGNGLE